LCHQSWNRKILQVQNKSQVRTTIKTTVDELNSTTALTQKVCGAVNMVVFSQLTALRGDIASQGSSNSTLQKHHFQSIQQGLVQHCAIDLCPVCEGQIQRGRDTGDTHQDNVTMNAALKDGRAI
jgi:hypothetical protein